MITKFCSLCKLEKETKEFSPRGNGKFASRCKKCLSDIKKRNYIRISKNSTPSFEEKECKSCGSIKLISEFYRNYNCLHSFRNECKKCNNSRTNSTRIENSSLIQELKSNPCMDCGITYPYYVMDFDHRDSNLKIMNVSEMRHHSKKRILDEISKCDLVCSNCHRIRSFNRLLKK